MTSETPPYHVPRAPSKPSSLPRPASSLQLAKAIQLPGQRQDELARWWSQLEDAVLALRAGDGEVAVNGAERLRQEVELAVRDSDEAAEEQWALLGSARAVLGLALEERQGADSAEPAYEAAVDAFTRAGSWPARRGDVAAYHGQALLGAGRVLDAADILRRAASELGEDTPDVRRSLGVALMRAHRLPDAERVLLDAVARAPFDWRAQIALATAGEALDRSADVLSGRWTAAAAALDVVPDPDRATAAYERARGYSTTAATLQDLGVAYATSGRAEDAERTLREADLLSPSAQTRLRIADVVAVQGDVEEAAAVAASAVPLGVEHIDVVVGLAAHLLAVDRLDDLDQLTEGLPSSLAPVADTYRGIGLIRRDRVADGVALIERSLPAVPPDVRLLLAVAATALDLGRTDLAASALDRILEIDPADPRALAVRGILRLQLGTLDAAESDLRAALDRRPGLDQARAYLGDLLRISGRFEEADAHLGRAVDDGADEAWVLASRAEVLLLGSAADDAGEAESLYRQALERDPDLLVGLCGLAMILLDRVDSEARREVRGLLDHALDLDAGSPLATAVEGEVLRRDGRTAEALDHFERALDEDSEWVWGLGTWAQALRTRHGEDGDRRHLEKALSLLTRAVSLQRDASWLRAELAEVHADLGEPGRALAELRIAAKLAPDDPRYLIRQAQVHAGEGDLGKAERLYRRVVDAADDYPEVRTELAGVLRRRRRTPEALAVLDEALAANPDDIDARYLRYQIHADERRLADAAADLDRLRDRGAAVQVALSESYRLQGRYAEARVLLDDALAADTHDAAARGLLGVLEWAEGNAEPALADLEDAVAHSPDDEFVVANLVDVLLALGRGAEAERRLAQLKADKQPHLLPIYADVLSRTGRPEDAVQLLERALWSGSDDVRPLAALGRALLALERDTEAVACFRRIVELRPEELDPLCDLAIALQRTGDLAAALATVAKMVEERPDDPLGWQIRSELQASTGRFDAAVESAIAATGCLQQTAGAYEALGRAHLYSTAPGRAEPALAAYRRARELEALNPWIRSGEADALHLLGDERDRQCNQETLELIEHSSDVGSDLLGLRGWCLFRLGKFDRALMELLRAASLTTRPAQTLFDLVLVVLSAEAVGDARTFFRRAVEELHREPRLVQRGRIGVARRDLDAYRPNLPAAMQDVVAELGRLLDIELARVDAELAGQETAARPELAGQLGRG